ncbi:MAG: hypothetical protein H7641_03400 [Candidatus Heimdallarchaeota archaeon]|nr:hypothetical protein [Candidatus Heimdallarchaeota archaeon]MCK4876607.1 hypothetical protein [Candidatus Heimdallarchaeota archaeon]
MVHDVTRIFGVEFIILDLIFCFIWMIILIRKKYILQWLFGLFGAVVVFLFDYVLWYTVHDPPTRIIYSLPEGFTPLTFLIYFSFTYGMIEFSFAAVMFSAKSWRKMLYWTILLYTGWFVIGLLPRVLPMSDTTIHIVRQMTRGRWLQIGMVVGGYLLLIVLKFIWEPFKDLTWKKLGYLFLVGVLVHFAMEITLFAAGIRPIGNLVDVLLFNSLIEFNSGIPFIYFGWALLKDKGISIGGETEELPIETAVLPSKELDIQTSLKKE